MLNVTHALGLPDDASEADILGAVLVLQREVLIARGVADRKLTAALKDWAQSVPLATLRSFLAAMEPIPIEGNLRVVEGSGS